MQGQECGQLVDAKGLHLRKPAGTIDPRGLLDVARHPGSARHRRQLRQIGRHEEHREQRPSHKGQCAKPTEQEWQHDEARDGVLEKDVAIPDENKMGGTDEHEECQSPDEQYVTARTRRQVLVLNGKAHSKKEGEQRERLQIDASHQYRIKRAIELGAVTSIGQETLKNRDAEYSGDVNRHDAEQSDATRHVDRRNSIGRRYRASAGHLVTLGRLHHSDLVLRADRQGRALHNM
jgi:hypothetical protein